MEIPARIRSNSRPKSGNSQTATVQEQIWQERLTECMKKERYGNSETLTFQLNFK